MTLLSQSSSVHVSAILLCALVSGCAQSSSNNPSDGADASGDASGEDQLERPRDYIASRLSTKLIIEIDQVDGWAPREDVASDLARIIADVVDKPDGVAVQVDRQDLEGVGTGGVWTFAELRSLAESNADLELPADTVSMHTLWLDGHYENENVLGVAWANRYIAMFAERIAEACEGRPLLSQTLCTMAETSVWTHEVGHVLGLVNNGIPMVDNHEDDEHKAHDVNDKCVMYWAYESPALIDVLLQRIEQSEDSLGFGDHCKADLAAIASAQ